MCPVIMLYKKMHVKITPYLIAPIKEMGFETMGWKEKTDEYPRFKQGHKSRLV